MPAGAQPSVFLAGRPAAQWAADAMNMAPGSSLSQPRDPALGSEYRFRDLFLCLRDGNSMAAVFPSSQQPSRGRTAVPSERFICDSQDLTLHAVLSDGDNLSGRPLGGANKRRKLVLTPVNTKLT